MYNVVVEKGYEVKVELIGWLSYLLVMGLAFLIIYYWKMSSLFSPNSLNKSA